MTASTKAAATIDLPYKWEDITSKLSLTSDKEIPKFILVSSFLEPWVQFRDLLPLKPGVAVPTIAPRDKDAMNALTSKVYDMMDCMATSKYDRPTSAERKLWTPTDFMECLLYQSARNLAREGHPFHMPFQRPNLKNEAGRREAFHRLRGLIMLVCNLTVNYTLMSPSNIIRRIEATRPAKEPGLSPILEVRMKWQLDHMGVDELRRKVLDSERKGQTEKEWLIDILLGKAVGTKAGAVDGKKDVVEQVVDVEVKKEGSVRATGGGVKRGSAGEDDEARKKARTVG